MLPLSLSDAPGSSWPLQYLAGRMSFLAIRDFCGTSVRAFDGRLRVLCMKTPIRTLTICPLVGFGLVIAASSARADNFIIDDFNVDVILGTVSVQNASGNVLQTFSDLWVSTQPSIDMATYLASNAVVPTGIQNLIGTVAVAESMFTYLDGPIPAPVFLDVAGNISTLSLPSSISGELAVVANDLATVSVAPVTSSDATLVSQASHEFDVFNPSDSIEIDSVIHFNLWVDSVVETTAAPEPKLPWLVLAGIVGLAVFSYRRVSER
jgi:hypothetical protein